MDSAILHPSEHARRIFGENHILAITFPAHTTNLFQVLNLLFFGVFKKLKESPIGEFDDDSVNAEISKLIHAYEQTVTSSTRRTSFQQAGFEHDITVRPFKLQVVEERLRENPGFQEISGHEQSIEALSGRRRKQPFGIIKSEFVME
jgi:hypothetical protein